MTRATPARSADWLIESWERMAPRARAPRVVTQPARASRLDQAIETAFGAAYRDGWQRRLHQILVDEGHAALDRLDRAGGLQPVTPPSTVAETRRIHDQITVASVEHYLTRSGWRPLDVTPAARRWHNGTSKDKIVEVPTTEQQRRFRINTIAYTVATLEGRTFPEVLADIAEPALADPRIAHIHDLITSPPPASDARIATRLDTLRLDIDGNGELPLRDIARREIAAAGATDIVWQAASATGEADAAAYAAEQLGTEPAPAATSWSGRLFSRGQDELAEDVAARIWAAGDHLAPAAQARWFARTWWPYHVTATARAAAAYMAAETGHPLPDPRFVPAAGRPDARALRTAEKAARPPRDGDDRFVAVYRVVDAAARPNAVAAASSTVHAQLRRLTVAVDELAIDSAARLTRDPRRFGHRPTDAALRDALDKARPTPDRATTPATKRDRADPAPPRAAVARPPQRSSTARGEALVIDLVRHRRHQLVTDAVNAIRANRIHQSTNARRPAPGR